MDQRYAASASIASTQFGAITIPQLEVLGVDNSLRYQWAKRGLIDKLGRRSYAVVGSPDTWQRSAWAAMMDVEGSGYVGGRTAARLNGLDGFAGDEIETLVRRSKRAVRSPFVVRSTALELSLEDTITIDGIRCLTAERLILDSPLFGFTKEETENAIDSSIRLRLVSEQRLRTKVIDRHRRGINGGKVLLDALVDTGGASRLERWFLRIVRRFGLPRPQLQRVWRDGERVIARVDAYFGAGLIVEVAGHGTHAGRRDRQRDEQRRTELTLLGNRVITFTYDDVRGRPDWVGERLLQAIGMTAAA